MPFFRGKTFFYFLKKYKKTKKMKTNNKEGLGPSEVALGATSPDP